MATKQISARIPEELRNQLFSEAAEKHIPIRSIITQALEARYKGHKHDQ